MILDRSDVAGEACEKKLGDATRFYQIEAVTSRAPHVPEGLRFGCTADAGAGLVAEKALIAVAVQVASVQRLVARRPEP